MKYWWILFCLLVSQLSLASHNVYYHNYYDSNSRGDFGLGFEFGEPMALTGKYWLDDKVAIQMGLGYSWREYWTTSVDILFHGSYKSMHPYIGIGGELAFNRYDYWYHDYYWRTAFLARVPIGFEFRKDSFGFFAEVCPAVVFGHDVYPTVQGGIGFRFYIQ